MAVGMRVIRVERRVRFESKDFVKGALFGIGEENSEDDTSWTGSAELGDDVDGDNLDVESEVVRGEDLGDLDSSLWIVPEE